MYKQYIEKIVYCGICTSCLSAFYTLTILRNILIAFLVHIRSIIFFYVLLIMFFFLFLNSKLVWDYFSSFQFILTLPSFFSRSQIEPISLQNFVRLLEFLQYLTNRNVSFQNFVRLLKFLQYLTNRTRFIIEFCAIAGISPISHKQNPFHYRILFDRWNFSNIRRKERIIYNLSITLFKSPSLLFKCVSYIYGFNLE